jgi:hypothetical protein
MPRMKQRHSPKTHDDNANEGKERIETQANIVLPKRKTILLMKAEANAENARRYSERSNTTMVFQRATTLWSIHNDSRGNGMAGRKASITVNGVLHRTGASSTIQRRVTHSAIVCGTFTSKECA